MGRLILDDVTNYVEEHIGEFHAKRLAAIRRFELINLLKRKNAYLLKAKNVLTAQDLVSDWLGAHLSSQEETMFGEFLEGLAIFICGKVYGGRKSTTEGIDLELAKDGAEYLVTIKSGPNWGNSGQIAKMKADFARAKRIRRTNIGNQALNIIAVNGCCYGRDNNPDKGEYLKLCGELFWEFISGDANLYKSIIEPLGHKAQEKNDEFFKSYSETVNLFTAEFVQDYCVNGRINWEKLIVLSSAKAAPRRRARTE